MQMYISNLHNENGVAEGNDKNNNKNVLQNLDNFSDKTDHINQIPGSEA